ncbi:hypothetical protein [Thermodesulfatator autotrophicus]|uniref:Uncharacterized protein n=1 Tax=Thermodesulfatator autotrophicus TaxID=1795632 RepID=A0A177E9V2_9BACT|nr:hypothetical protein [Thermodesulfatator autotrophicus]OAG28578.1 hypothetical protein TH606_01070 [Thermodesulfatator autotrophicus]
MNTIQELFAINEKIELSLKEKRAEELPALLASRQDLYEKFFHEFTPKNEGELALVKMLHEKEKKIAALAEKYREELLAERKRLSEKKACLLSYEKTSRGI